MDARMIGGIGGSAIGVLGGALGTYLGILHTRSRHERTLMIANREQQRIQVEEEESAA